MLFKSVGLSGLTTAQYNHCRGRTRDQPSARQAHQNGCFNTHRDRPANPPSMGRPETTPGGAHRIDGDRIANKSPIRFGRTGLDAVTRLRVGELRFHKGQHANVHRFNVAGGGPFFTARCRDCSTHFIPQESSAGRNLITVFRHVNNPEQIFFGLAPRPSDAGRADPRSQFAPPPPPSRRRLPTRFRKAHKKRRFVSHASMRCDCAGNAAHMDACVCDACQRPLRGWSAGRRPAGRFGVAQVHLRENCANFFRRSRPASRTR